MTRQSLWFDAPRHVTLREEALPEPAPGEVGVKTHASAISPGTEMLIYRGEFPEGMAADEGIAALGGALAYPLKYGYATVGQVNALGSGVASEWLGRWVFAFHPHESDFAAPVESLLPIPPGIAPEDALFLPNTETAVNFLLDGAPLIGEQVAVFGQGVVGLLTTALLARLPLGNLTTFDRLANRRAASLAMGARASLEPVDADGAVRLRALLNTGGYEGADLVYELSGAPAALDQAIAAAGFSGRVVLGSWYGRKRASLDLGGRFHRARIRLISSQVSTLTPELHGRWTKARRMGVAWERLRELRPSQLITHRYPFAMAAEAYAQVDLRPAETLQVILTHTA